MSRVASHQPTGLSSQTGFIQGAILVGLALLVVVVAGFSLGSRSSSASLDKEQLRVDAVAAVRQLDKVAMAVKRAVSAGDLDPALATNFQVGSVAADLIAKGYLVELPKSPNGWPNIADQIFGFAFGRQNATLNGEDHYGTTARDYYVEYQLGNDAVAKARCEAYNKVALGAGNPEATVEILEIGASTAPLAVDGINVTVFAYTPGLTLQKPTALCIKANGNYYAKNIAVIR